MSPPAYNLSSAVQCYTKQWSFYFGWILYFETGQEGQEVMSSLPLFSIIITGGVGRDGGELSFSMSSVSNCLGVSLRAVRSTLATLCWDDRGTGEPGSRQSDVLVEFSHPSFIVRTHCNYSPADKDNMCDLLHQRVLLQERQDLARLVLLHSVLQRAVRDVAWMSSDGEG